MVWLGDKQGFRVQICCGKTFYSWLRCSVYIVWAGVRLTFAKKLSRVEITSQFHLTLGSLPLGALTQTSLWCLWAALHPNHRCFTAAFNLLGSTEVWVSAINCEKSVHCLPKLFSAQRAGSSIKVFILFICLVSRSLSISYYQILRFPFLDNKLLL